MFTDLLLRVKRILLEPGRFFETLKKETGVKKAFFYLLVMGLWSSILGLLVSLVWKVNPYDFILKMAGLPSVVPPTNMELILFSVLGYGAMLLLNFVVAGILHGWILLFGGKERYAKTYQLYIYSGTPGFVLGWVPFIGFFTLIYDLILLIIGTQKVHGISKTKSILMYVVPIVLLILFFVIIGVGLLYIANQLPTL